MFSPENDSYAERNGLDSAFRLCFCPFSSAPRDSSRQKISSMDLKLFELGLHEVVRSMECELAVRQQNTLDGREEVR